MISPKNKKTLPDFSEEKKLWRRSFKVVIGVDEVGRGSWAGPVVASAVAFALAKIKNQNSKIKIEELGINDSKALRSQKREDLAEIIKECSIWSVGEVGMGIINKVGIGKATARAMRRAIINLSKRSDLGRRPRRGRTSSGKVFVLVDAFHIKYLQGVGLKNQKAIIHGDQRSISIAAASILAKVYRDNLMRKLAKKHPQYGWGRNKGYGTKEHQEAILKYGITRLHRKKFVETFLGKLTNLQTIHNKRQVSRHKTTSKKITLQMEK